MVVLTLDGRILPACILRDLLLTSNSTTCVCHTRFLFSLPLPSCGGLNRRQADMGVLPPARRGLLLAAWTEHECR